MKSINFSTRLLLTCLCFVFVFSSCDKDEDDTPSTPKNEFTLDGTSHDISLGTYSVGETFDGAIIWYLVLGSNFGDLASYNTLDLIADSNENLADGTYSWSEDESSFTTNYAATGVNVNFDTLEFDYFAEGTGGTVTVSSEGDNTILEYTLTMEDGEEVIGYFNGVLQPE